MSKALDELRIRIQEFESDLDFVSLSARLRPRLGDVMNWAVPSEVTELARNFMDSKSARIESLLSTLLVRLMASLERYIRNVIAETLEAQTKTVVSYDQLNSHIRNRNTALTGILLASIESPRDHLKPHFESLIKNLASCQADNPDYKLNFQAFGAAIVGTAPATIEKGLANIGFKEFWDRLGADKGLQTILETKKARDTGKAAWEKLEDLSRKRNHLAHGGDEETTLTEEQLRGHISFVINFANALDKTVLNFSK